MKYYEVLFWILMGLLLANGVERLGAFVAGG